jgi:type IV pilus assembly protein PilA
MNNLNCARNRRQLGFSLIELLIVVAIIIVIITFALPKLTQPTIQANEASAINSIATIQKAQVMYASRYPMQGFTCTLSSLGPPPQGQSASTGAADMIDGRLAAGAKDGYTFSISGCTTAGRSNTAVTYQVTATPIAPGQTGIRAFCSDQSGNKKYDPSGNAQACLSENNLL